MNKLKFLKLTRMPCGVVLLLFHRTGNEEENEDKR